MISLPIDDKLDEIALNLQPGSVVAVVSPPGSGKSTRVAPFLVRQGHSKKAVMLQPRRIAVRSLAKRICEETNSQLGEDVGYQIRFEDRSSSKTRLKILTEGLLSRQLMSQGDLTDIDLVIFDEFHERSLHTDVSFGMCLDLQKSIRPDLKILVMSATLDVADLSRQVEDLKVVESAGRSFPIDIRYSQSSMSFRAGRELADRVVEEYSSLQSDPAAKSGDVLVFLPGMSEIRMTQERLLTKYPRLDVMALHSQIEDREQDRVFDKPQGPRIVLSTNIAETSITLPFVTCVMDSGLKRASSFDFNFGTERLDTVKISRASATQRSGRAGRIQSGVALRLWTRLEQDALPETDLPEILRADLLELRLWLARWGVRERSDFPWVTQPLEERWKMAETELVQLGALQNAKGLQLTDLGRVLSDLPLSPRMGRVLLEGYHRGVYKHTVRFSADQSLNTKRRMTTANPLESILFDPLPREGQKVEQQLLGMERKFQDLTQNESEKKSSKNELSDAQLIVEVAKCILASFPARVCKRRAEDGQRALMASGRGVQIEAGSPFGSGGKAGSVGGAASGLLLPEWFIALDPRDPSGSSGGAKRGDAIVSQALPIQPDWLQEILPHNIQKNVRADFTSKEGRVMIYEGLEYLGLPLKPPHQKEASSDLICQLLSKRFSEEWPSFLKNDESMQQLCARFDFLSRNEFPGFAGGKGLEFFAGSDFVTQMAGQICMGCGSWNEVLAKNWAEAAEQSLDSQIRQSLEVEAPSHITVPAGSRIALDFRNQDGTPRLAVRLQEVFGWMETPRLAKGRVPILIELLAPNFRPVQLTRDLSSFWKTAYFEVKRDLRIKYPKHSWPEDPLTAKPEAKGRRRG